MFHPKCRLRGGTGGDFALNPDDGVENEGTVREMR